MKINNKRSWLTCVLLTLGYSFQAISQNYTADDVKWAQIDRFTGNDAPFISLRKQLESEIKKGQSPLTFYNRHLANAQKGQVSALYLVGLSAFENWKHGTTTKRDNRKISGETFQLMYSMPDLPQSYEFLRMRFLLTTHSGYARGLAPLGRKLLQRQPNDQSVEFRYAYVLIESTRSKKQREEALQFVFRLKKKYPAKNDDIRSLLSTIYMIQANLKEDPKARAKQIAIYEELLREYRKRPQTPRTQESIRDASLLLKSARRKQQQGR